jgi:hypothetical protein
MSLRKLGGFRPPWERVAEYRARVIGFLKLQRGPGRTYRPEKRPVLVLNGDHAHRKRLADGVLFDCRCWVPQGYPLHRVPQPCERHWQAIFGGRRKV